MKNMRHLLCSVTTLTLLTLTGPVLAQASTEERVSALKERIASLDTDTTRVEDILSIQRLQRAFGYYLDKGFFGEAADLFTEDGQVQYGVDGIYKGQERIAELFTRHGGGSVTANGPGLPFGRLNMHMQLQPMVTVVEDGQSAQARWKVWSLTGEYNVEIFWGNATLENDYIKEDGVWKVDAMRYYIDFEAPYEGGWASLEVNEGDWRTPVAAQFPPDESAPENYQPFPSVFVPPYHFEADKSAIQSRIPGPTASRPDDALGRLEAIADQQSLKLARVSSLRAVENLQAMYGYYIDEGQWQEAAALFSEDGVWEFGHSGAYIGPESIERGLSLMGPSGLEEGQLNNYPMLQPIITVSADNTRAWGRWRSDVMLARDGKGQWGGGLYENEYVNDNGTWKISRQQYFETYWGDYDQGLTRGGQNPLAPNDNTNQPDAPSSADYEPWPNNYVLPFHFDHPVTGEPHVGVKEGPYR